MSKRHTLSLSLILILLCATPALSREHLRLATTTSTENSGLLGVLLPPFEQANGCKVDVIAVGTGKAIKLGEAGDVDIILVHARAREDKFIREGYGVDRRDVMYNDFVILGPPADPAVIKGSSSGAEALKRIADTRSPFVSRGDDSGTHSKERSLWESAGIEPEGNWYLEAGRGMGEVIGMATELRGYTLSDRGTYIAMTGKTDLVVMTEGHKTLFNPYGVIPINPERHPHVKHALAQDFVEFLTGSKGQQIIASFRKYGQQLFFTY
ncbi:MAG: substrate-binding domain-containing protein [Desulfuromonadales bacterium]|nr:substrate-binding domain-containing protein [Desulfuromonadales bacterium]